MNNVTILDVDLALQAEILEPHKTLEEAWEHFDALDFEQQHYLVDLLDRELISECFMDSAPHEFSGELKELFQAIADFMPALGEYDEDSALHCLTDIQEYFELQDLIEMHELGLGWRCIPLVLDAAFTAGDRVRVGEFEAIRVRLTPDDEWRYAFYRVCDIPKLFGTADTTEPLKEAA